MVLDVGVVDDYLSAQAPQALIEWLGGRVSCVVAVLDEGAQETPPWRASGVKLINRLMDNGGKLGITDSQSGFRAYSRRALEELTITEDGMGGEHGDPPQGAGERPHDLRGTIQVHYYEDSSTHNPLVYAVSVVLSIVKHLSINKPLTFYGIPGITSMLISLIFWA